jgi:hypothetical protein
MPGRARAGAVNTYRVDDPLRQGGYASSGQSEADYGRYRQLVGASEDCPDDTEGSGQNSGEQQVHGYPHNRESPGSSCHTG